MEPATLGSTTAWSEPVVHLQPQPFKLLCLLTSQAGKLVTREEIRAELWDDTFVDFEQGVNFAIKQVREALSDQLGKHRGAQDRRRAQQQATENPDGVACCPCLGPRAGAARQVVRVTWPLAEGPEASVL